MQWTDEERRQVGGADELEIASLRRDGTLRMTSAGRGVVRAAERGDVQAAADAASRGRDAVGKREERAAAKVTRDQARAAASGEVAETLKGADQALSAQRQSTQAELQSSVDNLSQTLASRILGVELASDVKSGGSH